MVYDGGPAFPAERHDRIKQTSGRTVTLPFQYPGMSLRDWFAGQALAGIMGPNYDWFTSDANETGSRTHSAAHFAYSLADAMLTARKDTPDEH